MNQLAGDKAMDVEIAVAQKSNSPDDILQQLAYDTNRIVRLTAKVNLAIKNTN